MRGVLFIGAKNVDSSFDSFLASSKPSTALNALGNPLLDPLSLNKLSVLAEVDDEDTAGSSATSSPQCTIDPIAIAAATTEVITSTYSSLPLSRATFECLEGRLVAETDAEPSGSRFSLFVGHSVSS